MEYEHEWSEVEMLARKNWLELEECDPREWTGCLTAERPVVKIRGRVARIVPVYSRRDLPRSGKGDVQRAVVDMLAGTAPAPEKVVVGPDVGRAVAGMALRTVRLWLLLQLDEASLSVRGTLRGVLVTRLELHPKWNRPVVYANELQMPVRLLEYEVPHLGAQLDAFVNGCLHDLHRIAAQTWRGRLADVAADAPDPPEFRCPTCGDPEFRCHHDEDEEGS